MTGRAAGCRALIHLRHRFVTTCFHLLEPSYFSPSFIPSHNRTHLQHSHTFSLPHVFIRNLHLLSENFNLILFAASDFLDPPSNFTRPRFCCCSAVDAKSSALLSGSLLCDTWPSARSFSESRSRRLVCSDVASQARREASSCRALSSTLHPSSRLQR